MSIENFKILNMEERKELYEFIKCIDSSYHKNYESMVNAYEGDVFNEGESYFIIYENERIKGCLGIITKEINLKGEAFITDIYIKNEDLILQEIINRNNYINSFKENYLAMLIKHAIEYSSEFQAKSIKLGVRKTEDYLKGYLETLNFKKVYNAIIMTYTGKYGCVNYAKRKIQLHPLTLNRVKDFMNIHNETFKNSPNGSTIDEFEVQDYIINYTGNDDMIGLCFYDNKLCGTYQLSTYNEIGWIDELGILPSYHGKGLGKALLKKCINKLENKQVQQIKLLVISSNKSAMNLYKTMGFNEESVFSTWYEKTVHFVHS